MIRVAIIADSAARARRLADLLGEEERIEVLTATHALDGDHPLLIDVVVTVGVGTDQLPLGTPVVALSHDVESALPGPLIRAFLPLNAPVSEIVAAIIAAASDLTVFTHSQVRRWLRNPRPAQSDVLVEALTPREREVLRMLADGFGNKEIAARLGISDHTAKFHVTQILGKLGAGSRTEAVAIGIRRGLVPI